MKRNFLPILAFFIAFFCATGLIYLAKRDADKSAVRFLPEPKPVPAFWKSLQDFFEP